MCVIFMYNGSNESDSDYSLIVATNRDEFYDRPSQMMSPWSSDPLVIGGRDLEADCGDSTWLAVSPYRRKLGVLLNLPSGITKENAKSRGKLAAKYVKTDKCIKEYIEYMKDYTKECNEFIFVTAEFGGISCSVHTYTNATDKLSSHDDISLGFGNCMPDSPLRKVEAGRNKMADICQRYKKIDTEKELVDKLIELLKSNERHLPDNQLMERLPNTYNESSSIFVSIPENRYGTRTHTVVLVTKQGRVSIIEFTMRSPIDTKNPLWDRTELQYDIDMKQES